jgi:uncharacterized OB-fold protein
MTESSRAGGGSLPRIPDELPRLAPMIHPDTVPFWDGLERGELLVQRCRSCGTARFPFGPVCHVCRSFETTWDPIPSDGTVAVAALVHRATGDREWADHVPFASGTVDVAEDLRLPGRILCDCGEGLRHGAVVRAVVLVATGRPAVLAFAHACRLADAG